MEYAAPTTNGSPKSQWEQNDTFKQSKLKNKYYAISVEALELPVPSSGDHYLMPGISCLHVR